VGLVALAAVAVVVLAAAGFAVGLAWTFAACWKQTCSDVDAAAVVLLPMVGIGVGVGLASLLRSRRAWFYARPLVVWLPLGLLGALAALAAPAATSLV
jgi:hypothetical protein